MQLTLFGKKYILNEYYQKSFKKLAYFFLSILVPFYRAYYKSKRGLELITSISSGCKTYSEKFLFLWFITLAIMMVLYRVILRYSKNVCKSIHNVIIILISSGPLQNVERKGTEGKITKLEYLNNGKSFLNETKSIFHRFWNASLW